MNKTIMAFIMLCTMLSSAFAVSCEANGSAFQCKDVKEVKKTNDVAVVVQGMIPGTISTDNRSSEPMCERGIETLKNGRRYITTEVYSC